MTTKLNFNKKNIDSLPIPEKGKRNYYNDEKVPHLQLMVTDKGTKSFKVYKRINGTPNRVTLGKYPQMTPEQARKEATLVTSDILSGNNPNSDKRKRTKEETFEKLFSYYHENYCKIHKKTWKEDERNFDKYLKSLHKKKATDIKKIDIEKLLKNISTNNGIYTANRNFELIRAFYNKINEWEIVQYNPCLNVKKFKEKSRERFLSAEELPKLFDAIDKYPDKTMRDFFYTLLFTGARKSNVIEMKWEDIRIKEKTWRIPETKNGESLEIALSEPVMEILQSRKTDKNKSKIWVFHTNRASKKGHITEPKKAWAKILEISEIENLRMHDLRRTLGSWQAAMGSNSYVIGKSLGHKSQSATAIYARLNLDPVRESISKATDAMLKTRDDSAD